jgi:hypothetical protein
MTPEGFLMLLLISIGLGSFALYLRLKIYLLDRRARRSNPRREHPADDGSRAD